MLLLVDSRLLCRLFDSNLSEQPQPDALLLMRKHEVSRSWLYIKCEMSEDKAGLCMNIDMKVHGAWFEGTYREGLALRIFTYTPIPG